MSDNKTIQLGGGIGIGGLLGVLFVGLKLAHVIDWSWFLVTLPFLIGPAIVLSVVALIGIVVGGLALFGKVRPRIRRIK